MATFFKESKKLARIDNDNIHRNTFHLVNKIVKIGPVDPKIALLNLKKNEKKRK